MSFGLFFLKAFDGNNEACSKLESIFISSCLSLVFLSPQVVLYKKYLEVLK